MADASDSGRAREPQRPPSITHPRHYLDHVLRAKGIELPALPPLCVITYGTGLLQRAVADRSVLSFELGVTAPTGVHVVDPGDDGSFAIAAGRPGAPMAAVLLEELIELGFERFLSFGTAGHPSNGDAAPIGRVVLPDRCYAFEGTSRHYGRTAPSLDVDGVLRDRLAGLLREAGIDYVEGPAATTDAFYRETPAFVAELCDLGVQALEMELSALLSVARFHGRPLASVLCISDVIHLEGTWLLGVLSDHLREVEERLLPVIRRAAG